VGPRRLDPCRSIDGQDDVVAEIGEDAATELGDRRLVLDQQDRLVTAGLPADRSPVARRLLVARIQAHRLGRLRQADLDRRPRTLPGSELDLSARLRDEPMNHGQAEPAD
jgi:hypothetical protein